jgi:hypothetical protein
MPRLRVDPITRRSLEEEPEGHLIRLSRATRGPTELNGTERHSMARTASEAPVTWTGGHETTQDGRVSTDLRSTIRRSEVRVLPLPEVGHDLTPPALPLSRPYKLSS